MAMTPEGKVKKAVRERLNQYNPYYFMPATGGFGKSGVADIVCCINGFFVAIECKKDRHAMPTALQTKNAFDVARAGGVAILIHDENLDYVDSVCKSLMSSRRPSSMPFVWPVAEQPNIVL